MKKNSPEFTEASVVSVGPCQVLLENYKWTSTPQSNSNSNSLGETTLVL